MKSLKITLLTLTLITTTYTNFINETCQEIDSFNTEEENVEYYGKDLGEFFDKKLLKEKEEGIKLNGDAKLVNGVLDNNSIKIKIIDISKENPEEELKLLSLLKEKPGFVKLHKCVLDEKNQKLYLFFEKKEKDLSIPNQDDFKKKSSKKERLELYKEVLLILDSLHKLNYIHGEVAPWNIMTDENYKNIALIDFDNSTEIGKPSKGREAVATLSPEKFADENTTSKPEIDIYALGMSILIIEPGHDKVIEFFDSSFKFSEEWAYGTLRNRSLKFLKTVFDLKMRDIGIFERFGNWVKSFFNDNRIERINDFSDLVENMCAKSLNDRLKISQLVNILDDIILLYTLQEDKELVKSKDLI